MINENAVNASELGYAGALRLSGGLLHMQTRVYHPRLRRFLQPDVLDVRRYTYVAGDPANYIDPMGMEGEPIDTGPVPPAEIPDAGFADMDSGLGYVGDEVWSMGGEYGTLEWSTGQNANGEFSATPTFVPLDSFTVDASPSYEGDPMAMSELPEAAQAAEQGYGMAEAGQDASRWGAFLFAAALKPGDALTTAIDYGTTSLSGGTTWEKFRGSGLGLVAKVGTGVAVSFGILRFATPVGWAATAGAAVAGGAANVGVEMFVAWMEGRDYSVKEGLYDFASGAVSTAVPGGLVSAAKGMMIAKSGLAVKNIALTGQTLRQVEATVLLYNVSTSAASGGLKPQLKLTP